MKLIEAATKLRDYLVDNDFAGDDGDIPDDLWILFCNALKAEQAASTNKQSTPLQEAKCTQCIYCPCRNCKNHNNFIYG